MGLMNHFGIRAAFWSGCAAVALCTPALAQEVFPPDANTPPRHHHLQGSETRAVQPSPQPSSTTAPAAASVPETPPVNVASAAAPPSLLDKPAEPPRIDLAAGRLTIHADNSSLADILHRLTSDSGMTVDGLGGDQRIFGSYGPGDPQEVLSTLLDGSGYNVVMVGRTETGTPKQLSLTPRGARAATGGLSRPQQIAQDEDNDDEIQQPIEPPGAPQPPQEQPQQPNNGVRSPQQMLQEMQQMRQQQQLQQQQQQQSAPQPQQQ
jgi:hypothetical protein